MGELPVNPASSQSPSRRGIRGLDLPFGRWQGDQVTFLGWYQVKLFIEHASGISMDALHVVVGFVIFLIGARILKCSIASPLPWLALLMLELGNEVYDLHVELWPDLASQLGEAAKDILLTMALPTLAACMVRWQPQLFARRAAGNSADRQMPDGS